ncbi:Sodium/calcium exchanger protein-domain-containing protein [Elsinoe ampelina]|uniref:Sodium/calcium exchanger protein-domain-containing protein n=1 Tax=Elsinoe ampelina TaxID=302913 RepID=A0A6A6GKZ1_9PEZI|nr:Sodium/calcium exchanger protein-domain-containing protein [Elsinoe ampelina]
MTDNSADRAVTTQSQASGTSSEITSPRDTSQDSQSNADGIQYESIRTRSSDAPRNYGSISSTPARSQTSGQGTTRTPKRPATLRQASSSRASTKAKGFSVDDSQEEVDLDARLAKTQSRELRRQASTIRRKSAAPPLLARVESDEREDEDEPVEAGRRATIAGHPTSDDSEDTIRAEDDSEEPVTPDDEDADGSDLEDFTLKDRQEAINETHPFGIRIWKPALYKKDRSVQANAEGDIHSSPGGNVSRWLSIFNVLWTLVFGWWLALIAFVGGILCIVLGFLAGGTAYGFVLLKLAGYIFYPFGKFVRLEHDEAYLDEDEGEGRSISEYERWQTGDLEEGRLFFGPSRGLVGQRRDSMDSMGENDALLGRPSRVGSSGSGKNNKTKKRPFGRGAWNPGRVVYFTFFYVFLTPLYLLVSALCWFLVFPIPMGRVVGLLLYHLRRHPLALSFHSDSTYSRQPDTQSSSILLCTYRAGGIKYWKYTVDGTNIFLINLLALVAFTIFDFYVLHETLHMHGAVTSSGFIFVLAMLSIIPLAYFIGQAVASISAQSTMGVGATVNAFFSTVIEVFLYCVALRQGKAQLVEGSIIGSIFAGILLLPGLSMCFGAIRRKTQRFNVKSASATSTMLMFALIGSFGPTLFYQIYGSHELNCHLCSDSDTLGSDRDCRRCYFNQSPDLNDRFFLTAVRPYIWFSASLLFLSYVIGLIFTLRTHASIIWNNEPEEKKEKMSHSVATLNGQPQIAGPFDPHSTMVRQTTSTSVSPRDNIKDSQLYKRILGQSLRSAGIADSGKGPKKDLLSGETSPATPRTPFLVPPEDPASPDKQRSSSVRIPGLSTEDNNNLVRQVAEMAATAATVAARDVTRPHRERKLSSHVNFKGDSQPPSIPGTATTHPVVSAEDQGVHLAGDDHAAGGHDAPNWSRSKSIIILLTATVAYAVIAEILVDTVDSVLDNVDIDEKFVGITLFALVPNTTEFLNAISFAMNGNIALSMEIGSAYALQVMLLQVPALVLFTAIEGFRGTWTEAEAAMHSFSLIFPQWDMVTVILGLFLMNYVVGEGKSNYFKGSMLVLSYLVVIVGFWFTGYNDEDILGINRFDTLAIGNKMESFKTVGHTTSGFAYRTEL